MSGATYENLDEAIEETVSKLEEITNCYDREDLIRGQLYWLATIAAYFKEKEYE